MPPFHFIAKMYFARIHVNSVTFPSSFLKWRLLFLTFTVGISLEDMLELQPKHIQLLIPDYDERLLFKSMFYKAFQEEAALISKAPVDQSAENKNDNAKKSDSSVDRSARIEDYNAKESVDDGTEEASNGIEYSLTNSSVIETPENAFKRALQLMVLIIIIL